MKKIIGALRGVPGRSAVRPAVFLFCLSVHIALAGLDRYSGLVVADSPEAKQRPGAVRVTYLGVNGYQFEANGRALLVDPYFTRAGLTAVALQQRIEPDEARIAFRLQHIRPRADAVSSLTRISIICSMSRKLCGGQMRCWFREQRQ